MIFNTDSPDWTVVFQSNNKVRANQIKLELEAENIDAVIVDKVDSLYPMIGVAKVLVSNSDFSKAMSIIEGLGN